MRNSDAGLLAVRAALAPACRWGVGLERLIGAAPSAPHRVCYFAIGTIGLSHALAFELCPPPAKTALFPPITEPLAVSTQTSYMAPLAHLVAGWPVAVGFQMRRCFATPAR